MYEVVFACIRFADALAVVCRDFNISSPSLGKFAPKGYDEYQPDLNNTITVDRDLHQLSSANGPRTRGVGVDGSLLLGEDEPVVRKSPVRGEDSSNLLSNRQQLWMGVTLDPDVSEMPDRAVKAGPEGVRLQSRCRKMLTSSGNLGTIRSSAIETTMDTHTHCFVEEPSRVEIVREVAEGGRISRW